MSFNIEMIYRLKKTDVLSKKFTLFTDKKETLPDFFDIDF